jgi:hypothetical protein
MPAKYSAVTHFKAVYCAAHMATERLTKLADDSGALRPRVNADDTKKLLRELQEATCAARALDNLLAGNPPPRRGE